MADKTKRKHSAKSAGAAAWLKENPALAKVLLLVGLLVVLVVILGMNMLLSGGKRQSRSPSPSAAAAGPPPAPAAPAPPPTAPSDQQPPQDAAETAEEGGDEEEGEDEEESEEGQVSAQPAQAPSTGPSPGGAPSTQPPPGGAAPSGAAAAAESKRPEKVSDWKMADYFSARVENDPRLIEAVGHLAERFAGSPKAGRVAEILAELLAPPKEKEEEGEGEENKDNEDGQQRPPAAHAAQTRRTDVSLIAAMVSAIGDNRTETARKILEQLVAGTLPTEDDEATALAALGTLAAHPSAENEAILFRALTAAEELRPPGRGKVTAERLREEALGLLESDASAAFRIKLAKYLVEPSTPGRLRETLGEFLEQHHPDNLGAQLVLYQNDDTAPEIKTKLEEYLIADSSQALGLVLGIATDKSPDPDLPYRMARQLWAAPSVAMLEDRLGKLESLQEQSQLVVLAATIPVDSIRSAVLRTLQRHWDDGPEHLESAGLLQQTVSDPGLLMALKTLCRRQTARRAAGKDALEKFQQTKDEWTKFSDDLVRAWCERFHAAAPAHSVGHAQHVPPMGGAETGSSGSLPITLHSDAKVAAELHLAFPSVGHAAHAPPNGRGDMRAKLSGVAAGAMEIYFVRIEEKARRKSRLGYYKRQLKARADDVRQFENSDRVESFRIVPQSDRRRSIDVLITRAEGGPDQSPGQKPKEAPESRVQSPESRKADEELVIEILLIEMKDPAKS